MERKRYMSKEEYIDLFKQALLCNNVADTSVSLEEIFNSLIIELEDLENEQTAETLLQLQKAYQEVLYELVGDSKVEKIRL